MMPIGKPQGIHVEPSEKLRPGKIMHIRVIKRLFGSKWAIGVEGRVLPAVSDIELRPGDTMMVRVQKQRGRILLKVLDEPGIPYRLTAAKESVMDIVFASLVRSRLTPSQQTITKLSRFLRRQKQRGARAARALTVIAEKGIEPGSKEHERLWNILLMDEKGGERGTRERRDQDRNYPKNEREAKEKLKEVAESYDDGSGGGNILQLFNHVSTSSETWIVVPFRLATEISIYRGLIKIRWQPYQKKVTRLVLEVLDCDGKNLMSFSLTPTGKKYRLSFFTNDKRFQSRFDKKISNLASKLQNHGVECDDIIYDEDNFDGFSPLWEDGIYRRIDEVG
jgi:hypothetical protein